MLLAALSPQTNFFIGRFKIGENSFLKIETPKSIKVTLFIFILKKSIWWTVYWIMIWIYLETRQKKIAFSIHNLMNTASNFEIHQMHICDVCLQCTITDKVDWLKSQFYNLHVKLAMYHSHVDHIQCRIVWTVLWILHCKMWQNNPRSKPCYFTSDLYLTIQKLLNKFWIIHNTSIAVLFTELQVVLQCIS